MLDHKYIIRDIERAVCLRFHLTPERLRGPERQRKIARPRQIAMYLARELTGASLPQIGRHFARDHTTVLFGCKKIAKMAKENARMPVYLAEIRAILEGLTPVKEGIAARVQKFPQPARRRDGTGG
jgi:chromosomal replication initiator protein